MASPCKVSGDRFDVLEEEIVLSSKHTGVWRVISKSTSNKEGHIHRLTTKDLERIHKQDVRNERTTPRAYICIRDIEAFELVVHSAGKKEKNLCIYLNILIFIKIHQLQVELELNDV